MTFFNHKSDIDPLERLIKHSQADFTFDQQGLKTRLLTEIEEQQMQLAEKRFKQRVEGSFFRRHKWATLSACLMLAVLGSGITVANTYNLSKPGDRLYPVDQLQEQLILKLPLPESKKAEIQTHIVEERNQELDYFIQANDSSEIKTSAVNDSVQSLDQAVESIKSAQVELYNKGKTEQADKMNLVLNKLEQLATEQEQKVESLKEKEQDANIKKELEQRIKDIKEVKARAQQENKPQPSPASNSNNPNN